MKIHQREKRRGSILLLVLFLLIILAMMGSAFSILLPVEMQNAKRDRANIQTAYAADAGILWVMDQLDTDNANRQGPDGWKALEGHTEVFDREWEWRISSVDRLNGTEAYRVVSEGIRVRGSKRDVLRRAVAIIDNGLTSEEAAFLTTTATLGNGSSPMGANPNTYWPGNVPINGDVIVIGTWSVDNGLTDYNNGPTFNGTIYQTEGTGSGLLGENYLGGNLTQAQYNQVYANGLDGVKTVDVNDLSENVFLGNDAARTRMQEVLFSTQDKSTVDTMHATTSSNTGIHIPLNADGVPNGGLVVNDGGTNHNVVFSENNGNSIMTYSGINSVGAINTLSASAPSSLTNVSATPTGNSFKVIHVYDGTSYGSTGEDRLVILSSNNTVLYNQAADFSAGTVIYNHGQMAVEGTFTGKKTVAASQGVTITDELLKAGIVRGRSSQDMMGDENVDQETKDLISNSLLGLVANVDAGNSSDGFVFDFSNANPPDNNIYLHASMMGLAKTDVNTKMFGHNAHHNNAGYEVHTYGQIASGPTNSGQFKKELEAIANHFGSITMDELPIGFPSKGDGFRSNLRAYVDQQSFETD
jgi:hypothetical protein